MKIYLLLLLIFTSCSYFSNSEKHDFYRSMEEESSCEDGSIRSGYENPSAIDGKCRLITQTCVNSTYIGARLYPTCEGISKNCGTLKDGESFSGYTSTKSPCVKASHKCVNGLIEGPLKLYKSCK